LARHLWFPWEKVIPTIFKTGCSALPVLNMRE
jgi:hypothetical protein